MTRIEQVKKEFYAWKRDTDTTSILYSKNAHECIAWLLYEQVADMISGGSTDEEIASFSKALIKFGEEEISE